MNDFDTRTVGEALEALAEADEESAANLIPELRALLDEAKSMDAEEYDRQTAEVAQLAQQIRFLRANAEGIRNVLKMADE